MADIDPLTAMQEARRRGLLPQEMGAAYEEAVRRGLIGGQGKGTLEMVGDTLRKAGNAVTGFVSDLVVGDRRREFDFPELPGEIRNKVVPGKGVVGTKMGLARDDLGKYGIFSDMMGNRPGGLDKFGNVWVEVDGKQYYLNRPGASPQDVDDIANTAAIEAPFIIAGGAAGKVLGPVGRVLGVGTGAGAGSVAQDVAAMGAGSDQGIDPAAALIAATFGVTAETAGAVIAPFLSRLLRSRQAYNPQSGTFTSEGRAALERAGLDPDKVNREFAEEFNKMARNATDPQGFDRARRMAEGRQAGVRLSEGDVTRDVTQQGREESMRQGAMGETAQTTMQTFRDGQTEDLLRARGGAQESLGGPGVSARGEGVDAARAAFERSRRAAKADVSRAYNKFDAADAYLERGDASRLRDGLKATLEDFDVDALPTVKSLLDGFDKIVNTTTASGEVVAGINFRGLEAFRRRILNAQKSAVRNDPTANAALQRMKKEFDGFIDEAVDQALIRGDADVIAKIRDARELRSIYGRKFEGDKIVDTLLKRREDDPSRFALTASEATDYLLGAVRLGEKRGVAGALRKMHQVLDAPPGKELVLWRGQRPGEAVAAPQGRGAWNALREESFLRLFPGDGETLQQAVKNFDRAMTRAPEVMRELFTPAELNQMRVLRNVVDSARSRVPGAVNNSATFYATARFVRDAFGPAGRVMDAMVRRFGEPFAKAAHSRAARDATMPLVQPALPPPTGLLGIPAAVSGQKMIGQEQPAYSSSSPGQ